MAQIQDDTPDKASSSSEPAPSWNPVWAKRRLTIQKCFRQSMSASLEHLQKWYEEYKAVEGNKLDSENEVILKVQSDKLDEDVIEKCIAELAEDLSITNSFCEDCQHLFDNWPDLGDTEAKDPSTGLNWPGSGADWKHTVARECNTLVLEAAMRNGCKFCAFLVQMIRDAELLETMRKIEARLEHLDGSATASLSVQNWAGGTSQLLWINYPGKVCDHCNSGVAQETKFESAGMASSADTYETQRDVLDIANTWIEECIKNHTDCKVKDQDTRPTRLICITGDSPRLVLTESWSSMPLYSTLSHRWGSEDFLKLTRKNYNSFFDMIPPDQLPKTFKDAIHISQKLGMAYLWIDSLCIIQGDTEDWRKEASLMSSVYGGSYINIAASSAENVHGGCFLKSSHTVDGVRALITVNEKTMVREFRSMDVYALSTTKTHLATRAWAVQEKILPARTIHFSNRGAFWECKAKTANQFLPGGFPDQLGSGLINQRTRHESFTRWWSDVVQLYSAANLTFAQDKLPALSGIARSIHEERGEQYVAGMWRVEDFEAQLCWKVFDSLVRPSWRAPSWSWASVDGQIVYWQRWDDILDESYAHVLEVDMELVGQDPFGELSGGCLRIGCSGMLAAQFSGESTVKIKLNDIDPGNDLHYPVLLDYSYIELEEDSTAVYLMPVLGGNTGSGRYADEEHNVVINETLVCGLVLQISGDTPGNFRRIGLFEFFKDSMSLKKVEAEVQAEYREPFLRIWERSATSVAEAVCVNVLDYPKFPNERYVIHVV